MHPLDPDLGGDALGRPRVVAGQQHRREPERAAARAIASALVGLTVSATTTAARGAPSQAATRAIAPSQPRRSGRDRPACDGRPTTTAPVDDRLDPSPRGSELVDRRQLAELGARGRRDRPRDRMLGRSLGRAGEAQHARRGRRRRAARPRRARIRPSVTVPVLSSTIVSTRRVRSSTSGPLDQDAELRAAAGADHQRRRRREPERARAGDDQHGDRGGERGRGARRRRASQPASVASEMRDHDRDEDRRDPVGEPLHRRLAGLRLARRGARSARAPCRRRPASRARRAGPRC